MNSDFRQSGLHIHFQKKFPINIFFLIFYLQLECSYIKCISTLYILIFEHAIWMSLRWHLFWAMYNGHKQFKIQKK